MIRLVFLDIDGVLNSRKLILKLGKQSTLDITDPDAVARLNRITDATRAMIVVSSTWRIPTLISGNIQPLRDQLAGHGIKAPILGVTPDSSGTRGSQIQQWLDIHIRDHVGSFIILDDDSDMDHLTPRLVKTTFEDGLLDSHVEQAIALLMGDQT